MSQKQLNRFAVITKVIDSHISIAEAATSLALSERQIKRLKKGVKAKGAAFLIHKNTGRKPSHSLIDNFVESIIKLKQSENYQAANFMHFKESLHYMKTSK